MPPYSRIRHITRASCPTFLSPSLNAAALVPVHLLASPPRTVHVRYFSTRPRTASSSDQAADIKTRPCPLPPTKLTHLSSSGDVHMVQISEKASTLRTAVAVCSIHFSDSTALTLVRENAMKKGDVLGVARIAGIMAAKQTANLIPLCHPISLTHVSVQVTPAYELGVEMESGVDGQPIARPESKQAEKPRHSVRWAGTGQGDAYRWSNPDEAKTSPSASSASTTHNQSLNRIDIKATVSCQGKTGVEMEALTAASTAALTIYDMCKAVDKGMHMEGLRVVRKEGGKTGTWVEGKSV